MTRLTRADAGGGFCFRPRKTYKDESHRVPLERAAHARQFFPGAQLDTP